MIEFILASNLSCAHTAEVIDRAQANLYLSKLQIEEIVEVLIEHAPKNCVLVNKI